MMLDNEQVMKDRGASKVWKTVMTKANNYKNISSTQIGQQLLFEEALQILEPVRDWIENGSATVYRTELKEYFINDEILLEKIVSSFLFLSGAVYEAIDKKEGIRGRTRHKKIKTLRNKILPELSFEQAWRFVEVIIDLSSYFDVERILNYEKGQIFWNLKYVCNLSEVILGKLAIEAAEAFYPMPMLTPPINWSYEDGRIVGGYEEVQYEMVRATQRRVDYSLYSKYIFDAVNYIQATPWIVNEEILDQLKLDLRIPKKADFITAPFPDNQIEICCWDVDLKAEDIKLSKREVQKIESIRATFIEQSNLYYAEVSDFESALGKYRAIKLAIQIAERYVGKTIYFPHSYDFRGRVYPIPIGLSPQGSDEVKALLLYKNTIPLTASGIEWSWAYLASLYGDDKITFDSRVDRGMDLINADYREADEPYQFLSHQLELKKWIADRSYIPNTRIHLDACNSGSQFTSVITGDREGCIATNIIPTYDEAGVQIRKDAYMLVADKALDLINSTLHQVKSEGEKALVKIYNMFSNLLAENGRAVCKVPVMVSNYGGTEGGRSDILWNMFREMRIDKEFITKRNASILSRIIGDSITGVLSGGKAFETYIHRMNNIISKNGKPITWITSDGFHVTHVKNKELKAKQVSCMLPGSRRATTIIKKIYSDNISAAKMKSAISPNYIHSLDAELLRRVALKMRNRGILDSDWIHDSFGCHPNHISEMLDITKKEFLIMARRAPLYLLDKQLREQASKAAAIQAELKEVKIPLLRGFNVGNGDLEVLMNSEWFFS